MFLRMYLGGLFIEQYEVNFNGNFKTFKERETYINNLVRGMIEENRTLINWIQEWPEFFLEEVFSKMDDDTGAFVTYNELIDNNGFDTK